MWAQLYELRAKEGQVETVAERVRSVLERIRWAAARAGRRSDSIRLVAASKFVPVSQIREAVVAGVEIIGESRLQEALPKIEALGLQDQVQWHFIGRLQRRKVRGVVGRFEVIHSVDSLELAAEIDRRAGALGCRQAVLLEVNLGGESSKGGFSLSALEEKAILAELAGRPHLEVRGLMTIPPPTSEAEEARPYFCRLRELAWWVADQGYPGLCMRELSMGMSADYLVAVEEGATLVRIGTAIFGPRPAQLARLGDQGLREAM